jgi:hypothetical protein
MLETNRAELLNDLKLLKSKYPDLKIVCTDVREGAESFGLIPDPFNDNELASY